MVAIEVSEGIAAAIRSDANALGISEGQVVARWLGMSMDVGGATRAEAEPWTPLRLYAQYRGVSLDATYLPATRRVRVISGPAAGRWFKSPSGAARACVEAINPDRKAIQGNGWRFWRLSDTGERLEVVRQVRKKA
jgi:hypothetical protein